MENGVAMLVLGHLGDLVVLDESTLSLEPRHPFTVCIDKARTKIQFKEKEQKYIDKPNKPL